MALLVWTVYALLDPSNGKAIRYVGITRGTLQKRLQGHMRTHNKALSAWLQTLLDRPLIRRIDSVQGTRKQAEKLESVWVRRCVEQGHELFNRSHFPRDPDGYVEHLRDTWEGHRQASFLMSLQTHYSRIERESYDR